MGRSPVEQDGRRRAWLAVDETFPHGATAQRILAEFGRDGLLTWILFLAACKRNRREGHFEYVCEADGWAQLGILPQDCPQFTLENFFRFTGRIKQTRLERNGTRRNVCSTNWQRWQRVRKRAASGVFSDERRGANSDPPTVDSRTEDKDLRTEDLLPPNQEELTALPLRAPSGALHTLGTDRIDSFKRLLERVSKGDAGTPRVVQGLCKQLPSDRIDRVAAQFERRRVPAGVLVNALKTEVKTYEEELLG